MEVANISSFPLASSPYLFSPEIFVQNFFIKSLNNYKLSEEKRLASGFSSPYSSTLLKKKENMFIKEPKNVIMGPCYSCKILKVRQFALLLSGFAGRTREVDLPGRHASMVCQRTLIGRLTIWRTLLSFPVIVFIKSVKYCI